MVIFTSRSEKKALAAVRRVLDLFADRIGNDTWKTVITAEGLRMVHLLLRRTATKDTAVACHWIRSRSRSELVWIVGRRDCFNESGVVPVSTTEADKGHQDWENDWTWLPVIQALVALASLLHDWGKASDHFQKKLEKLSLDMDPFRHEWVSVKLLEALVAAYDAWEDDRLWLMPLAEGTLDIGRVQKALEENAARERGRVRPLPPAASLLVWLILSHHKLPVLDEERRKRYKESRRDSFGDMLASISADWGYRNEKSAGGAGCACFQFRHGLLWGTAQVWTKYLKKWAGRLLQQKDRMDQEMDESIRRWILSHARLCLMWGDHYISSLPAAEENRQRFPDRGLWANSDPLHSGKFHGRQSLEEHLVRVCGQALRIAYQLPRFAGGMEQAEDIQALRLPSPRAYAWQDKAARKIMQFRESHEGEMAWFIVNMASTGCGKTLANAKLMEKVSADGRSLRYNLALGLRTLTLQTGDEYRRRLGLDGSDMAVLVGSSVVKALHDEQDGWAESEEPLLDQPLDYLNTMNDGQRQFMDLFFDKENPHAGRNAAFLYKPVLVSTIDYLMKATETVRGGRYMLPFLRLMSSDLVIDEIDDFDKGDLIAIARLVHLAGMCGRNVAISSATIPPDLAEGMYRAYVAGLTSRNACFQGKKTPAVLWCDEFRASALAVNPEKREQYALAHGDFIKKRAASLKKAAVRRKGKIASFIPEEGEEKEQRITRYFGRIQEEAAALDAGHHVVDKKTGKTLSFGLIRMANIWSCVALGKYLLQCSWPEEIEVRILTYHSRQILLLRHEEEKYLDRVLKRKVKYGEPVAVTDPVLRRHIDRTEKRRILFIVVATPVEEVGRDHDFDWAVIEPSSYRSIIQLAGRILRHRSPNKDIASPNVTVMEYNLNGIRGRPLAFCRPGYETGGPYRFTTHDLKALLDESLLAAGIGAIPRIQKQQNLRPSDCLIDLEQKVMEDFNSFPDGEAPLGPESLDGWLSQNWWMTALPQRFNPFRRRTQEEVRLCAVYLDDEIIFKENFNGEECTVNKKYHIEIEAPPAECMRQRLWLDRSYKDALCARLSGESGMDDEAMQMEMLSRRFGEIVLPISENDTRVWYYSGQFGLYQEV